MRGRITAAACVALALGAAAQAEATRTLSAERARARAQALAVRTQAGDPAIVSWELSRAFRFTREKVVFVWDAEYVDGRFCAAQLVVRFASRSSNRVIAYFRNRDCS
jgi:hypothetical protein